MSRQAATLLNRDGKGSFFPTGFEKKDIKMKLIYPESKEWDPLPTFIEAFTISSSSTVQRTSQGKEHIRIRISIARTG